MAIGIIQTNRNPYFLSKMVKQKCPADCKTAIYIASATPDRIASIEVYNLNGLSVAVSYDHPGLTINGTLDQINKVNQIWKN